MSAELDEVTVFIVDDERLFRSGLSRVLDGAIGVRVVGSADTARALDSLPSSTPMVVLIDPPLSGPSGWPIVAALIDRNPASRVVILTAFVGADTLRAAVQSGASGVLLKDIEPAQLVRCIRTLAGGGFVLSPGIAPVALLVAETSSDDPRLIERLSSQECAVLQGISAGLSNSQIARQRGTSVGVVKDVVGSVFTKLEVTTRVGAAVVAVRAGLGPPTGTGTEKPYARAGIHGNS